MGKSNALSHEAGVYISQLNHLSARFMQLDSNKKRKFRWIMYRHGELWAVTSPAEILVATSSDIIALDALPWFINAQTRDDPTIFCNLTGRLLERASNLPGYRGCEILGVRTEKSQAQLPKLRHETDSLEMPVLEPEMLSRLLQAL